MRKYEQILICPVETSVYLNLQRTIPEWAYAENQVFVFKYLANSNYSAPKLWTEKMKLESKSLSEDKWLFVKSVCII